MFLSAISCFSETGPKLSLRNNSNIFVSAIIGTFKSCVSVATKSSFKFSSSFWSVMFLIIIICLRFLSSSFNSIELAEKLEALFAFIYISFSFKLSIFARTGNTI